MTKSHDAAFLALLRQVIDPHISGFTNSTIKVGASPSSVRRVTLRYRAGYVGVPSVIIKHIAPEWPNDPHGAERECRFYTDILPRLGIRSVHVYHTGIDPETGYRIIVMEDLAAGHVFHPPAHIWTPDEMRCLLRTYARLHAQGRDCLPAEEQRWWMMTRHETRWDAEAVLTMIDDLVAQGIWSPLPRIHLLVERTLAGMQQYADYQVTLLHNDVYPPNIALPHDLHGTAILIDWEMVGWGLAELDLAYLFMQPFGSAHRVNRAEALDYYWAHRQMLEGRSMPARERAEIQRYADAVLALSLVPVAHRVAAAPFPAGSAPRAYWDAMFGVLHARLKELCEP